MPRIKPSQNTSCLPTMGELLLVPQKASGYPEPLKEGDSFLGSL